MQRNLKSILSAVLLTTASAGSLIAATPTLAQNYTEAQQVTAFDQSTYNHCDVEMLSKLWGQNHYQSKLRLGWKILGGDRWVAEEELTRSREAGNSCSWAMVPHSYDDAVTLARAWGVSVGEAKAKAARFYSAGDGDMVLDSFLIDTAERTDETQQFQAFAGSRFNYCDAKMIGEFIGQDPYQGKLLIGQQVLDGAHSFIDNKLNYARNDGKSCDWGDVGMSYNDAQQLAQAWGVDVATAKTDAATYHTQGLSAYVEGADSRTSHAASRAWDVYVNSRFSYCDAEAIAQAYNTGIYGGKLLIGNKIMNGWSDTVTDQINRQKQQGHTCSI